MTPSSFLAPGPRLRRCCRAALLALAALLAVPVAAAAADEARLGEMLLAIEHDGRADPLSAARRLEAARAQFAGRWRAAAAGAGRCRPGARARGRHLRQLHQGRSPAQ